MQIDRRKLRRTLGTRSNRRRGTKTRLLIAGKKKIHFRFSRRQRMRPSVALETLVREQVRAAR